MTYHTSVYESGFYSDDPCVWRIKTLTTEVDDCPIIEIIDPVYPIKKPISADNRNYPPIGDVDAGWTWYIVLMFGATFCYGNWVLWILISLAFFTWKNGYWNGGKK